MPINYITGDATEPIGTGPRIIVHICNDIGGWGRGFVGALSRRWPEPERHYRAWAQGDGDHPFALGEVQFVSVADQLWVANLVGQHGIHSKGDLPPIRYDAIRAGLKTIASFARTEKASVHMPRIGAGLAGGKWEEISAIIQDELSDQGIAVTVYDLPVK